MNGHCLDCNVILRNREDPEVTQGKALEKAGVTSSFDALDPKITQYSVDTQLGILRQRQHPDEE